MKTMLVWRCPLCKPEDGTIERGSQEFLDAAIGNHILTAHEERAALRAVDNARISCPAVACEIGRNAHYNKTLGCAELKLTEYDRRLLSGMRIEGDEE